ncbi:hypothetical protein PoB_001690900 [Plakobranchus ocellatus]|uniref:Uncharacterized protein n=1 Tax=Plakobranchus ocellatus TaxID=259542 RepID=A0AAV3Z523_9GAST|nr:hypothetical protein PoB_001690900 [Plakobranchus ocellatus]
MGGQHLRPDRHGSEERHEERREPEEMEETLCLRLDAPQQMKTYGIYDDDDDDDDDNENEDSAFGLQSH